MAAERSRPGGRVEAPQKAEPHSGGSFADNDARMYTKSPGLPFGGPGLGTGGGYLLSHFRSTIGVARFNFSVRNGKRWSPCAVATLVSSDAISRRSRPNKGTEGRLAPCKVKKSVEAERKIHSRNEKRNTVAQPELSSCTHHGVPAARTQYDATRFSYLGTVPRKGSGLLVLLG